MFELLNLRYSVCKIGTFCNKKDTVTNQCTFLILQVPPTSHFPLCDLLEETVCVCVCLCACLVHASTERLVANLRDAVDFDVLKTGVLLVMTPFRLVCRHQRYGEVRHLRNEGSDVSVEVGVSIFRLGCQSAHSVQAERSPQECHSEAAAVHDVRVVLEWDPSVLCKNYVITSSFGKVP
jgi:hypothetical protein